MSIWNNEIQEPYPSVATFADLPLATTVPGQTYVVLATVGLDPAGLYFSNGVVWDYLGDTGTTQQDGTFIIQNTAAPTKVMDFDVSGVTAGQTRSLKMSNYDYSLETPEVKQTGYNTSLANPLHSEGTVFYDNDKHALSYYNEEPDVTINIGQETIIRVKNETGGAIQNGAVVYPLGVSGNDILIGLATAADKDKCRLIGMVTHTIEDGSFGYVTKFGEVSDVDTSAYITGGVLYLSDTPGAITNVKPTGTSFITQVGAVKKVGVAGSIVVDVNTTELSVEAASVTGWSPTDTATLSFSNVTRTLTITPTVSKFSFYQFGDIYTKTTDSYQIPDVEGLYLIYYNMGTLTHVKEPDNATLASIIRENPTVAYVYWNATDKKTEYFAGEQHRISMSVDTHIYLHFVNRLAYTSGLLPGNIVADGSGNDNASAQFSIASGTYSDEDLFFQSPAIAVNTGLPVKYISGATPVLRTATNSGYSVVTTGTGRLAYNLFTGGSWTVAEVPNKQYVCCHVLVNNSNVAAERVFALMGQVAYPTIAAARLGSKTELLTFESVGLISQEQKAVATFIFETFDSFTNAVKARIRTISTGVNYIDWRNVKVAGATLT